MDDKTLARFMSKVRKLPSGCWEWTGGKRTTWRNGKRVKGYGQFYAGTRGKGVYEYVYAHRASYEHFCGPIPEGYEVVHTCPLTSCVNPEHLQVMTHSARTVLTYAQHGGRLRPLKKRCIRGHDLSKAKIDKRGARVCAGCARERRIEKLKAEGVKVGTWNRHKTHCPKGHKYTPGNTYYRKDRDGGGVGRMCRKCMKEQGKARRARKKANREAKRQNRGLTTPKT